MNYAKEVELFRTHLANLLIATLIVETTLVDMFNITGVPVAHKGLKINAA